ncbi:MAG: carbon-nitrogen hydrolase family protein [Anaerolineae bacterium]|nr:carbon-nitrogen hydrolase family protein [Anaerolineae bacterium]
MTPSAPVRVAALQFAVGDDLDANLAACLRLVDRAARHRPHLMVLPEFVNHLAWYRDAEHCYEVAVTLDGPFVAAIAQRARQHRCYIKLNVTLRREEGAVTGTNILLDPEGRIAAVNDKQVLMGNENNFLRPACEPAPVVETPIGRLGMYACMDGVIPEVARSLAVRGAQVLLNSLNSFALDEAALHIPVRAAENRVFVVAANKVGPLVPDALRPTVAAKLQIDPAWLDGAGESQIVGPDGAVLAKAPRRGEAVVWADIEPARADDKRRGDGADLMADRRPALYRAIAAPPVGEPPETAGVAAPQALAAVYRPTARGPQAVAEALAAIAQAEAAGVQLLALPELFHLPADADPAAAAEATPSLLAAVQAALRGPCLAALTVVEAGQHVGVLVGREGVVLRQPQLHPAGRQRWIRPGEALRVADVGWARVALVVGNDALFPETFRLAALAGAEVVVVLTAGTEPWELGLGFAERAAENRVNLLVAADGDGAIYAVTEDFTLWTPWRHRPFDGCINTPVVTPAGPGLTTAAIYPAAAHNKQVSHRTHLLANRPWRLAGPLVA